MPAQRFVLTAMARQSGLQVAFGAARIDIVTRFKVESAQCANLDLTVLPEQDD